MLKQFYLLFTMTVLFIGCSSLHLPKSTPYEKKYSFENYYMLSAIADSLHFIKEYEKSFVTMDTVLKKTKPLNIGKFREYNTYLRNKYVLGKTIKLKEVKSLIKDHGTSLYVFRHDSISKLLYKEKNITQNMYDELYSEYKKSINLELRQKLSKAFKEDQEARRSNNIEEILKIDLKNQKILVKLFDKGIYPNPSIIGPMFYDDNDIEFGTLLLHTNDSIRENYFLPKIKKFIIEGKCHNIEVYLSLIDQNIFKAKGPHKQIYGTFKINSLREINYYKYNTNRHKLDFGTTSIEYDIWFLKR